MNSYTQTCGVSWVDDDQSPGDTVLASLIQSPPQFRGMQWPGICLIQVVADLIRNILR